MIDLKIINSILDQLEEERGISRDIMMDTIESALATAYKKEYGKKGQIIKADFDINTGKTEFYQVKKIVDPEEVRFEEEGPKSEEDERPRFNPEQDITLEDAKKMKKDAEVGEELVFPLEPKEDFGRIAAQTARQVIIQKIREGEKSSVLDEFSKRQGEIISGTIQRIERGNIYIDLGRTNGILPREEQIPGEHFKRGERIRAYLYDMEETQRGVFLRFSRSHPNFLKKLFEMEAPEISSGTVEIQAVAREPGSRSKIAVSTNDENIDPVGSLVGQRGVRVSTVMSELGGERIDIIEWSDDPSKFIEDALSPASILNVNIEDEEEKRVVVNVAEDQQSLAIGKGGQNVRLAAKLTGWKIDIRSSKGENIAKADGESVDIKENVKEETSEKETEETIDTETQESDGGKTDIIEEEPQETSATESALEENTIENEEDDQKQKENSEQ